MLYERLKSYTNPTNHYTSYLIFLRQQNCVICLRMNKFLYACIILLVLSCQMGEEKLNQKEAVQVDSMLQSDQKAQDSLEKVIQQMMAADSIENMK